jgi:hypothetical protein
MRRHASSPKRGIVLEAGRPLDLDTVTIDTPGASAGSPLRP